MQGWLWKTSVLPKTASPSTAMIVSIQVTLIMAKKGSIQAKNLNIGKLPKRLASKTTNAAPCNTDARGDTSKRPEILSGNRLFITARPRTSNNALVHAGDLEARRLPE